MIGCRLDDNESDQDKVSTNQGFRCLMRTVYAEVTSFIYILT